MQKRNLIAVFFAALVMLSFAPTAEAHTISCSTDPCATTYCTNTSAEAHAYGSEHSWADAAVGGWTASDDGVGHSHADATGLSGAVSASAKGKKDWSLAEENSDCTAPGNFMLANAQDGFAPAAIEAPIGVGCVADSSITSTASFLGRIYVTSDGFVAYDDILGQGLSLESLEIMFDGKSLEKLAPMDVSTMTPTNLLVSLELVDGDEETGNSCLAQLFIE